MSIRLRRRHAPLVVVVGAAAAAAVFVSLALLVSFGQLDAVDRYAVNHLMPDRSTYHSKISLIESLLSYRGHHFRAGSVLRLPASLLLSTLLVGSVCALLCRRNRRRDATIWAGVFVTGIALELLCKTAVTRPALYGTFRGESIHLTGFDSSFPSGHAVRAVILVVVVGTAWPALRPLLAVWLATVAATLEIDGIHAPSDIVGGLLLAGALVLAAFALDELLVDTPVRASPRVRAKLGSP